MSLLGTIRQHFANLQEGKVVEITDKNAKDSWVVKINGSNGVAIKVDKDIVVNEKFANMRFYSHDYLIAEEETRLLLITSNIPHLRNEFAKICRDFIELGPKNENRELLTTEPLKWWEHMKELIGNANRNTPVHNIIAEMLCFNYLLSLKESVEWNGPFGSTIDLVTNSGYFEVKSTTAHHESIIHINGQFQLDTDKPQQILFCRMEKSIEGYSIDNLVSILQQRGINREYIEERLELLGLPEGNSLRKVSYRVLECSSYKIDENFPKITPNSFKDNQIPKHIVQINYSIDLSGLEKSNITLI